MSGIGGSERHLLSLLPALAKKGVKVSISVLGEGDYRAFVEPLQADGVPVSILSSGPNLNPSLPGKIRGEIRRFNPDLVHTHLIHADLYGQLSARSMGTPGVSSIHSTLGFYRRQPYLSAARIAGRLAQRTIAISEHVGRFAEGLRLAPPDRIRVIPYGIEASNWRLPPRERREGRENLGIDPDEIVAGVASRLVANKGHDWLLDAMQLAAPEVPKLRLLIAGEGPLRRPLEGRAGRLKPGSVRFLGFVPDVKLFMNICDFVVFPSLPGFGEGFGLAALEALASGHPVIASDLDSLPEIVEDGRSGFLVAPGNVKEMAGKLVKLAQDPVLREKLGEGAGDRALASFGLDVMVDRIISLYSEISH